MTQKRELQIVLISGGSVAKKQTVTYDGNERAVHLTNAH
jgi:hypothetical protein